MGANDPRCPSLSCPLDSLPPGGQANHGQLAPWDILTSTLVIFTPGGQYIPDGLSYHLGWIYPSPGILPPTQEICKDWINIVRLAIAINSFGYAYQFSFFHWQGGGQLVQAGLSCPPPQCLVEYFLLLILSTGIYFCSIIMVSNSY